MSGKKSSINSVSPTKRLPRGLLPISDMPAAAEISPSRDSQGGLSSGSGFMARSRSQSGLGTVIEHRFMDLQKKQDMELERWKRKLVLQQQENEHNLNKANSLEKLLEQKSKQVMELQQRRQLEVKAKIEQALARVKANESRILQQKQESDQQYMSVSPFLNFFSSCDSRCPLTTAPRHACIVALTTFAQIVNPLSSFYWQL